jgi:hypothetical protein
MLSTAIWLWLLAPASIIILAQSVHGSPALVNIFPPDSEPYGVPIDKHIENWWKWLVSIPAEPEGEHPMSDLTGEKCKRGQESINSSVFYLSGAGGQTVNRICEVPAGKGLLIPAMTVVATDKEYPGSSVAELARVVKDDQDSVTALSLDVNGTNYAFNDLKPYRKATGEFQVTYPKEGIFGVTEAGPSKAVADGYYLITEPLSPGNYTIHFKGALGDPLEGTNFQHDISYLVIVK